MSAIWSRPIDSTGASTCHGSDCSGAVEELMDGIDGDFEYLTDVDHVPSHFVELFEVGMQ